LTPQQHNKYLAWSHLAYGGLTALFGLLFSLMFGAMILAIGMEPARSGPRPPPPAFFIIFATFFGLVYFGLAIPSFIAGYALLKQKRWAKTASIVAGVIAAAFFPIGTAVCVYTVWFLMSDPGKFLYDTPTNTFPGATSHGDLPPGSSITPPDWR
jgi:hypothetical protein